MECLPLRRRNSIQREAHEKHLARKDMAYRIRMINHNFIYYVDSEKRRCVEITIKGNQTLVNVDSTIFEINEVIQECAVFTELFHSRLTAETRARREREREDFRQRVKRSCPLLARLLRY